MKYGEVINAVRPEERGVDLICCPAGKSHGILKIAERLEIRKDEVAVIGDSHNDLEMFEKFNESFCMSSSPYEITKHARKVVRSVEEALDDIFNWNG